MKCQIRQCGYNVAKYAFWKNLNIPLFASQNIDASKKSKEYSERKNYLDKALDDYNDISKVKETLEVKGKKKIRIKLKFNKNRMFLLCGSEDLDEGGSCFLMFKDYFAAMDKLHSAVTSCGKTMVIVWIPSKERVYFQQLPVEKQKVYSKKIEKFHGVEKNLKWYTDTRGNPLHRPNKPSYQGSKDTD